MQFIAKRKKKEFPLLYTQDGTSRVQTVNKKEYPDFYKLIKAFMIKQDAHGTLTLIEY